LKSDYRYSSALTYNTFPIPELSVEQKKELTELAFELLAVRESHLKSLAELYDPIKMPSNLKLVHQKIDMLVDSYYCFKPIKNDEERLEILFDLYEEMTGGQNA